MERKDIAKSVGLSEGQLNQLLAKFEREFPEDEHNRRQDPRGARFVCDVELEVEHIGGGTTRTICCTRNISAGGVGLVLGSFLHRGSRARVTLSRLDGKRVTLPGVVAFCRHLSGKVHEVGVAFEKQVDPTLYITDEQTLAKIQEKEVADAGQLEAKVLHLVASPTEAALVAHRLSSTGLEPEAVHSLEDTLERLQSGEHAAIIVDADGLGGAIEILKRLKAEGASIPRVVLTADEHCDWDALKELGASGVVNKPFTPGALQSELVTCVRESGLAVGGPIYSTLADDTELVPMLQDFVRDLHETGERLHNAIGTGDMDDARAICLRVKGTAAGCGFEVIGEKATEALDLIDESGNASPVLTQLASMCRRAAVNKPAE
jgi:CheY-like chemotaxis protein